MGGWPLRGERGAGLGGAACEPLTLVAGLYLITPDTADTSQLIEATRAALGVVLGTTAAPVELGRVRWLQYRNKCGDQALRRAQAKALRALTRSMGVHLLINDDIELALEVVADGVHLGREDESIKQARQRLGQDAVLGASAYSDLERARQAWSAGANYVAFGSLFSSQVKPQAPRCPLVRLGEARGQGLQTVGIGGIDASHIAQVSASGAHAAAVISAVYDAACPAEATRLLLAAFLDGAKRYDSSKQ